MSEQDLREMKVEDEIFDLLVQMGISPRLRGFRLLESCIKREVNECRKYGAMETYQDMAQKLSEPWINVARAMHFAIKKAEKTIGRDGIVKLIGELPVENGRTEPVTFCTFCARYVRGKLYDLR